MPLTRILAALQTHSEPIPSWQKWTIGLGLVALAAAVRSLLGGIWPGAGFLFFLSAVLAAGALGRGGAGYVAAAASTATALYYVPPEGLFRVEALWVLPLFTFAGLAFALAGVLETLNHAIARAQRAIMEAREAEAGRADALTEFRHRSRNDLQSMAAALLLRARTAPEHCRPSLRAGAEHAYALAKIHTCLGAAAVVPDGTTIDARSFLHCLVGVLTGQNNALRPISVTCEAERHHLSSERAVQLGIVVHKCVSASLRYAFPAEAEGVVRVTFWAEADGFRLTIDDNGTGLPAGASSFGTRILAALAAQLRGTFRRTSGEDGRGTLCELRFPRPEPRGA